MEKEQKIIAICLGAKDYKDNDKILSLLSSDGKYSAIIKGVKKPNAKLKAVCQPFCIAEYMLVFKGDFGVVANAGIIDSNFDLLTSYEKYEVASEFLKLANNTAYQIQNYEELYDLITYAIRTLKGNLTDLDIKNLQNYFYIKLLEIGGYAINCDYCDNCGQELKLGAYLNEISPQLLCPNCTSNAHSLVSKPCLTYIKSKATQNIDINIISEAQPILKKYLRHYYNV